MAPCDWPISYAECGTCDALAGMSDEERDRIGQADPRTRQATAERLNQPDSVGQCDLRGGDLLRVEMAHQGLDQLAALDAERLAIRGRHETKRVGDAPSAGAAGWFAGASPARSPCLQPG